ncbi:MAG: protein kinase [Candidatus Eisenbacteria bacterium]
MDPQPADIPRLSEIFEAYFDLPEPQRDGYLETACSGDPALRRRAVAMIQAAQTPTRFLEPPGSGEELRQSIGRYRVLREIGRGAMGVVFLAEDPELERQVAIKTLGAHRSSSQRERIRQEALALASTTHPNIAQIYTLETHEPGPGDDSESFITMEYVPGTSLAGKMRSPSLTLETALDYSRQIASALEAAHARGIIHRDLKPLNIRITPDGWVKVLDFGLAGSSGTAEPMRGTLGYMSPEQLEGAAVDARSDLWSLGVILFECIARKRALPGSALELVDATRAAGVDWNDLAPDVPAPVVGLLRQCLHASPSNRPESATQVRRVLEDELLRLRSVPFLESAPALAARERRGNLPSNLGSFVGRRDLLTKLLDVTETNRLVTLVGMGGAGKTRTALEVARRLETRFVDGAWFVELADIDDADGIPSHVIRSLDLRVGKDTDLLRPIWEALSDRALVLIMDNCEHVSTGAARFIRDLLVHCPHLHVIATSRGPLGVESEQSFPLGPLDVPSSQASAASAGKSDAVALFEARAKARAPGFQPDEAGALAIASICRALDGLPLAIELAAGHVRTLPLSEIAARIQQDPRFLEDTSSRRARRHRSLRGLVDWSYRLLDDDERLLFDRLATFRGTWTLASAEAICADDLLPEWKVYGALGQLVEKSLVEVEVSSNRMRYRFLETVRHFALDRLGALRASDPVRSQRLTDRQIAHFVELARSEHDDAGVLDPDWPNRIRAEEPNLIEVIELALQRRTTLASTAGPGREWDSRSEAIEAEIAALHLVLHLSSYWTHDGRWRTGVEFSERVLAACVDTARTPDDREIASAAGLGSRGVDGGLAELEAEGRLTRALVLARAAEMAAFLDDHTLAEAFIAHGMPIAESLPGTAAMGRMLAATGIVAFYRVKLIESDRLMAEAEAASRAVNDRPTLARCLADRARVRSVAGKHDEARPFYEEALRLNGEIGDRLAAARVLANLGRTAQMQGRVAEAANLIHRALDTHREANDLPGTAICLHNLGELAWRVDGDARKARVLWHESLRIRHRAGQKSSVCSVLLDFAALETDQGRDDLAARVLGGTIAALRANDIPLHDGIVGKVEEITKTLESRMGPDLFGALRDSGAMLSPRDFVEELTPASADAE